jgi:hypothetical protein
MKFLRLAENCTEAAGDRLVRSLHLRGERPAALQPKNKAVGGV